MVRYIRIATLATFMALTGLAWANTAKSSYTKLDFDKNCTFKTPAHEEEEGMGVIGTCYVGNAPVIHYMEGDLRQSVGFGAIKQFQSFGQFNRMNTTIEWRSNGGRTYAAIMRFFIDHANNEGRSREGQVLVIHRVAETDKGQTCIVGMVDARANHNANLLARQVADTMAKSFNCSRDHPKYYGTRGKFAGDFMY